MILKIRRFTKSVYSLTLTRACDALALEGLGMGCLRTESIPKVFRPANPPRQRCGMLLKFRPPKPSLKGGLIISKELPFLLIACAAKAVKGLGIGLKRAGDGL